MIAEISIAIAIIGTIVYLWHNSDSNKKSDHIDYDPENHDISNPNSPDYVPLAHSEKDENPEEWNKYH